MISRYIVLSEIQLSQASILVEIQKLASHFLKNVPENKQIISGLGISYLSIITKNNELQRGSDLLPLEFLIKPHWLTDFFGLEKSTNRVR